MCARTIRSIIGAHLGQFLSIDLPEKECGGKTDAMAMKKCTCAGFCARALIPAFEKPTEFAKTRFRQTHTHSEVDSFIQIIYY
eukprot:COSAG06_NODE_11735_length_1471_cov_17.428571_2_plen_83_part_00